MNQNQDDLHNLAYGDLYLSALSEMEIGRHAIESFRNKGFDSAEACAQFAKDHHLDLVVYSSSQKGYFHVNYKGKLLTLNHWRKEYADDILFWWDLTDPKDPKRIPWYPKGNAYIDAAKVLGEETDGVLPALSHRDYFRPTSYYDKATQTFNTAIPFRTYAKETGRDTSHIYTYIEHLAGRCAPYLLAWLRDKCAQPQLKTEVAPIISSRMQGTGKTTFAEIICRGLFGKQNVYVTDKFDTTSKFNADYADMLIVCAEEKEEADRKVDASALKSMITADTIRKENKGHDPVIQKSFTEFIVTTNRDVPIKFDSEDQRRFMIMDVDQDFRRYTAKDKERGLKMTDKNKLADEVFSKLYGKDANRRDTGNPSFVDDVPLIQQFKHELFTNPMLSNISPRDFPRDTESARRCFSLPRTSENTEIDAIIRTLAPFIRASLIAKKIVGEVEDNGTMLSLANFLATPQALQYMPGIGNMPPYIAICRPLVFYDQQSGKPFNHATVERGILDCIPWLVSEYGIKVLSSQLAIPGGFASVMTRYRQAPAARFALVDDVVVREDMLVPALRPKTTITVIQEERIGQRLRVNGQWKPDPNGEYETVNEMKPETTSLENKTSNVQYMDTFLFEADDVDKNIYAIEQTRLKGQATKDASSVFMERLRLQKSEADRLLNEGKAFRVVYSGGKSYHVLIRIADSPRNLDEYKWLHAHLCDGVISSKLDFDPSCNDPARLTRAPVERERVFIYNNATITGKQCLYRELPGQVYDYNWRPLYIQWLNRPLDKYDLNNKRMRPAKQEYKDAMWALVSGSFWTDSSWNGRRQSCFFPAYRLCRLMGYSHEQLWSTEGILDGLEKYYRKSEINYWRERENSSIIKSIDEEVALQLEEEAVAIENG